MSAVLIIAVVAGALVAVVVLAGVLTSRRRERDDQRANVESQHLLGGRLAPPRDRSIQLPTGPGAQAQDAIEELRRHPQA